MAMRIETRDSVFEVSSPGTGLFELKKLEDLTPGKTSKNKEGSVMSAKIMITPKMGLPLTLKNGDTVVFKSGPVLKISGNL